MFVEDGTGSGYLAKVTNKNRLSVEAISISSQHYVSHTEESAYQASQEIDIAASEQTILLLQNGSTDKDMIVTYIRVHSASAAATNKNAYFSIKIGGTYASGGSAIVPTNVNAGSTNAAVGIFYGDTGIVTAGTFTEIDRNYTANSMQTYNKEGALILKRGQAILITHTGSSDEGVAYARVSFMVAKTI